MTKKHKAFKPLEFMKWAAAMINSRYVQNHAEYLTKESRSFLPESLRSKADMNQHQTITKKKMRELCQPDD